MSNKGEKKGISPLDFFCIGFGAIVGVGWAMSINGWIAKSGGPVPASLGYILALILMVPVALCYCELAPMMPVAGGGTAYAYRAFNEKLAFISGWAAFGGFVTIIPWEAIYVCRILSMLFPWIKGPLLYEVPIGLTSESGEVFLGQILCGVIFSTLLFFVNWKGATTSAVLQRVVTLVLVGAGILAMIVALGKFSPAHLQPIYENVGRGNHSNFFFGMVATLAAAPFFLAGFETIPQAVEDAKGDITSVGKTVVLSVSMACIFYALLLFTIGSAMPWQEIIPLEAPAASYVFRVSYGNAIGEVMYYVVLIGTLCGLFSTWNGFMMASPRLLMGMSRGYMMPRGLAKQNKYGTPTNGLIACYVLSLAGPFLSMRLIEPLTLFAAAGFVCSWGITSFSVVRLRKKEPDAERPYKLPGGSATAMFAGIMMLIIFVMLFIPGTPVYMEMVAIVLFVCWMVLGIVLYLIAGGARNKVSVEERTRSLFERR